MRPILLGLMLLGASGCVTPKPFELHPEVPPYAGPKLLLRAAVVVPTPMGSRITETYGHAAPGKPEPSAKTFDRTALYHGEAMMPMERELSRVCAEAFAELFSDVDLLHQTPDPGQYDVVVQARVTESKILQKLNGSSTLYEAVALSWAFEALDSRGVPFIDKTGVTEPTDYARIPVALGRMDAYAKVVGEEASRSVTGLVSQWMTMLAQSPELDRLVASRGKRK